MEILNVSPIGEVRADADGFRIVLHPDCRAALRGLDGFSHVNILWWFSDCDHAAARALRTVDRPYADGPDTLGIFATRAPMRPNPIALSCAQVTWIDFGAGIIHLAYIDANDRSPVLDLKPYTPSLDRVAHPEVPDWCAAWPDCIEDGGDYDWDSVFTF